jgi:hypothetical protein
MVTFKKGGRKEILPFGLAISIHVNDRMRRTRPSIGWVQVCGLGYNEFDFFRK